MRFLILASLLIAVVAVPAVAQTVPNWNCELGITPAVQAATSNATTAVQNWTFNQGNVATMANWLIGLSTTDPHEGTASGYLSIKGDNKYGTFKTVVSGLAPGTPYMVSAWLKQTGFGFIQISARPVGGSTVGGGQHASSTWSQETLNASVMPSAAGEIEIEMKEYSAVGVDPVYGDWSSGLFDSVTVSAIPEPSSLFGLLAGLPVLGLALRRKK